MTENAKLENGGPKMQGWKMQDWKLCCTNTTPSRGSGGQTSHISVAGDVADVDVDVDIDVADATSVHG